jgi:hypothetical protein
MPRRKGIKMNKAFIAHHRTVAKKTAIAWAGMAVAMGLFFALGWRVLMTGDAFNVFVGIGMISIGSVACWRDYYDDGMCVIDALQTANDDHWDNDLDQFLYG